MIKLSDYRRYKKRARELRDVNLAVVKAEYLGTIEAIERVWSIVSPDSIAKKGDVPEETQVIHWLEAFTFTEIYSKRGIVWQLACTKKVPVEKDHLQGTTVRKDVTCEKCMKFILKLEK